MDSDGARKCPNPMVHKMPRVLILRVPAIPRVPVRAPDVSNRFVRWSFAPTRALSSWKNRHYRDFPALRTFCGHCEKILTVEPGHPRKAAKSGSGFEQHLMTEKVTACIDIDIGV